VSAYDCRIAAETAYRVVSAVLGALAVFTSHKVGVRSPVVMVRGSNTTHAISIKPRVPYKPRSASDQQLLRIVESSLEAAMRGDGANAVFDAIRHRQRAHESEDEER